MATFELWHSVFHWRPNPSFITYCLLCYDVAECKNAPLKPTKKGELSQQACTTVPIGEDNWTNRKEELVFGRKYPQFCITSTPLQVLDTFKKGQKPSKNFLKTAFSLQKSVRNCYKTVRNFPKTVRVFSYFMI